LDCGEHRRFGFLFQSALPCGTLGNLNGEPFAMAKKPIQSGDARRSPNLPSLSAPQGRRSPI
jgi:hypothetical protein